MTKNPICERRGERSHLGTGSSIVVDEVISKTAFTSGGSEWAVARNVGTMPLGK
jgi:hypothetical protein